MELVLVRGQLGPRAGKLVARGGQLGLLLGELRTDLALLCAQLAHLSEHGVDSSVLIREPRPDVVLLCPHLVELGGLGI